MRYLLPSLGGCVILAVCMGCGSSGTAANSPDQVSFSKKTGANVSEQGAFINQLEATAPNQRKAFISQHANEMRNMALTRDPTLQRRYMKAMEAAR